VSDGWSAGIFVDELSKLYEACAKDEDPALLELPIQYADYAVWQRSWLFGDELERQVSYWTKHLAGAPALELPTDHPRPAERSERGALHAFTIDREGHAGLSRLSRRHGATLFMTLLAGLAALLQRATGEDDLVVGTPIAGRIRTET
jgi:hypothetical protein